MHLCVYGAISVFQKTLDKDNKRMGILYIMLEYMGQIWLGWELLKHITGFKRTPCEVFVLLMVFDTYIHVKLLQNLSTAALFLFLWSPGAEAGTKLRSEQFRDFIISLFIKHPIIKTF